MASSLIDNHVDRSHNPAALTRQGRRALYCPPKIRGVITREENQTVRTLMPHDFYVRSATSQKTLMAPFAVVSLSSSSR